MAASVIAAAVARARRRIVEHFLAQHAVSPEAAIGFVPESGIQRGQFNWMLRERLVHEARPDAYWLDAPAYAAVEEQRWRRITLVFGVIFAVLAGLVLLAYRS